MDGRRDAADRRALLVIAWAYLLLLIIIGVGFTTFVTGGSSGRSIKEWGDLLLQNAVVLAVAAMIGYVLIVCLYYAVSRLFTRR